MELNETTIRIVAQIFSGITYGCIYGLFGLSIVFLYRANKLFNFAATEMATFFTITMFFFLRHMNYFPSLVLTLVLAFIGGYLLHVVFMRVVTERKDVLHSNETVVTIGLLTIFNSLSSLLDDQAERFPTPFPQKLINLFGVKLPTHSIVIVGVTFLIVVGLRLFLRFTQMGLIMEATAQNVMSARLKGIKTSNVLAMAWGLTTATSVVAGVLVAPILFVSPTMLTHVFSYALIAVVIGGLESPFGAMVGGIIIGIVENLASNVDFIGSELKFVAVVFILFIVLLVKPRGLWGRAEHRRV